MAQMAQQQAAEEAAERDHQRKLLEIDRAVQLERTRVSRQAQDAIQGSFANMVNSLLNGTQISTALALEGLFRAEDAFAA